MLDRRRARGCLTEIDHGRLGLLRCLGRFVEVELTGVDPRDRIRDRLGGGDGDAHGGAERNAEVVRRDHVRRVVDGHEHGAVGEKPDGNRAIAASERFGEKPGGAQVDRLAGKIDEGELVLLGENAGHLRLRHIATVDEDLAEALPRGFLVADRLLELVDRERAVTQEQRSEHGPGMHSFRIEGRWE